jgi:hypothetical protein
MSAPASEPMRSNGFELTSVVHLVRPASASARARTLESLRLWIAEASAATLFYHTIQCPLRHPESSELPPDDFSGWVSGVVQDRETAERLSFAVQSRSGSAADLREALLEVLEHIPDKARFSRAVPSEAEFVMMSAESVTIPTGVVATDPEMLVAKLGEAEPGVWFYHLIEEAWYTPGPPAIARWAREHGDSNLARVFEEEARAGRCLAAMRRRVIKRWNRGRLRARVAAATRASEGERREAAHEAVVGLVRRITRPDTPERGEGDTP